MPVEQATRTQRPARADSVDVAALVPPQPQQHHLPMSAKRDRKRVPPQRRIGGGIRRPAAFVVHDSVHVSIVARPW